MDSFRSENGPEMMGREVKNLQSSLQVPEFAETTARGQRAIARDQSRGRSEESEPEMDNSKHSKGEPKGETKVNKLDFGNRVAFTIQTKASDDEIEEFDKVSMIAYMLEIHANPNNKKNYEKQFFKDCTQHMEEVERQLTMSIKTFDTIVEDNVKLQANPTSDEATTLVEKAKNLATRTKQFRNSDFTKIISELNKAANTMEESQITEREPPSSWIVKRKIRFFEEEHNGMLDQILFQNEIVIKAAEETYTKLNKPQKGYGFKPLDVNKPKTLTLGAMKAEWETLSSWTRKMKEYISSGHTDPEANHHTPTVRAILKVFLDEHICQRVETSLDLATTVEELYNILEQQEIIFWPLDKRLKAFFGSSRKSSNDPMGFLSELRKKAKFCKIFSIIDKCIKCNHCDQLVKVNPDDEKATEKIIFQAFLRGVNDNPFLVYICDELGRTNAKPSFNVINELYLQFTAASRLDYKNSNSAKVKKTETKKKHKQSDYCYSCYIRGYKSNVCKNAPGKE